MATATARPPRRRRTSRPAATRRTRLEALAKNIDADRLSDIGEVIIEALDVAVESIVQKYGATEDVARETRWCLDDYSEMSLRYSFDGPLPTKGGSDAQ